MSVITGAATIPFVNAADVAADGEPPDAASVRVGFTALLNGVTTLHDLLIGDIVQSDSITRVVPIGVPIINTDARFTLVLGSVAPKWWLQSSVADAGGLTYELVPPYVGAIPVACIARFTGKASGAAHVAWPPAWTPTLVLYRVRDGVESALVSVQDALGQAAYEQIHDLDLAYTDAAQSTDRLFLRFNGETGANAEVNQVALLSLRVQWSCVPL